MHEYFELTISQTIALSKPVFLELCSLYLEAALERDRVRERNRQARSYGIYIGLGMGPNWTLDIMLDWEAFEACGGDIDPDKPPNA